MKENPVEDTEGEAAVALTGEVNPHFDAMREWILKVVKTNTRIVCNDSHIGENFLLAQVSPCSAQTMPHTCVYIHTYVVFMGVQIVLE